MMSRKTMALAVAGVFAAPALALAQNATVQIYGKTTVEIGYADQGAGRPNTDMFQTPGGSAVGVRGEEKLGGGLSAWFQCESSADVRGLNQDGFCSRNSALGLKGAWGNLHFGRWDTPYKRAHVGMVGAGDTGLLGASFLFSGSSTGTAANGAGGQNVGRNIWKRRESSLIYYESPKFSGFQILAAFSAANATSATDASTSAKPRIWSVSGLYNNGPLAIGLGYEKHQNMGNGAVGAAAVTAANGTLVTTTVPYPAAAPGTLVLTSLTAPRAAAAATVGTGSGDDRGWTIGGSYTFAGKVKLGGQYSDYKYDMAAGTDIKKKNWMLGVEWNIAGPHNLELAYVRAGDSKGTAVTGVSGGNGPIAAPVSATSPQGTGAKLYEIGYRYRFSKRTNVKLAYVKVDNDGGANYSLGGLRAPTVLGESQSAFAMYAEHRW